MLRRCISLAQHSQGLARPTPIARNMFHASCVSLMSTKARARAMEARREIIELWRTHESLFSKGTVGATRVVARAQEIIDKYEISPKTQIEDDIVLALGENYERLIMMLAPADNLQSEVFENTLSAGGRMGYRISIRCIQFIFARCQTYAQAIAIFYALRRANVRLNAQTYYAMIFCLQRLEEESWSHRFHEQLYNPDHVSGGGQVTEQMMQFICTGTENQMLPENKPWLGRIMFAEEGDVPTGTREDYDALGKDWVQRYKNGAKVIQSPEARRKMMLKHRRTAPPAKNIEARRQELRKANMRFSALGMVSEDKELKGRQKKRVGAGEQRANDLKFADLEDRLAKRAAKENAWNFKQRAFSADPTTPEDQRKSRVKSSRDKKAKQQSLKEKRLQRHVKHFAGRKGKSTTEAKSGRSSEGDK